MYLEARELLRKALTVAFIHHIISLIADRRCCISCESKKRNSSIRACLRKAVYSMCLNSYVVETFEQKDVVAVLWPEDLVIR